jgi:hypothetical protein
MSSFKLRPRIKVELDKSSNEIGELFKSGIENSNDVIGTVAKQFIILKIPQEDRHFWSPQLTITIEDIESHSVVRGLYGPKQTVWAMFAFAYGTLAMLFSIVFLWASIDWQLNDDISLYYYLPVILVLAIITYFIAQFGQKLGAEQMFTLHHFFQDTIKENVKVE